MAYISKTVDEGYTDVFSFGYFNGENIPWTYHVYTSAGTAGEDKFNPIDYSGGQVGGAISVYVPTIDNDIAENDKDFFVNIDGRYSDQNLYYSYTFEYNIKDNDTLACRYDVDGNGTIDNVELSYSQAWNKVYQYETQADIYKSSIEDLKTRIDGLKEEAGATSDLAKATLVKYLAQVASLGAINPAIKLLPAVSSIVANAYNVIVQGESVGDAASDAWTSVLDVVNTVAGDPLSFLPLFNVIKDAQEALGNAEKFYGEITDIKNNIQITEDKLTETNQKVADAIAANKAIRECLAENASAANEGLMKVFSNFAVKDIGANTCQVDSANGIDLFHSGNLYLASTSSAGGTINASDASYSNPLSNFLLSGGSGKDVFNIGRGSSCIDGGQDQDLVNILDSSGHLRSAIEVNLLNSPENLSGSFVLGIGEDAFVAARDVEQVNFVDGSIYFQSSSEIATQITALYDGILGRAPDISGLAAWAAALKNGLSLHDIATAMLATPEAQEHLNATINADFVEQVYEAVLHRQGSSTDIAAFTSSLDSGLSRADFVTNAVLSPEHLTSIQTTLDAGIFVPDQNAIAVAQLYYALLHRAPDTAGLQGYTAALGSGATSLHDIAQAALNSSEYATTAASSSGTVTASAYVESVYEQVLGRHSDDAGLQSWTDALAHGTAQTSVAMAAVGSSEYQGQYAGQSSAAYVEGLYEHLFGRQGDAAGVQSWTSALDSHATTRVDLANAFVNSAEFQAHFGLQAGGVSSTASGGPSDAAFVEGLYENALGRHADAGGLQGWTDALAHGTSRADVAVAIAEGAEAQQHLAAQIQQSYHVA